MAKRKRSVCVEDLYKFRRVAAPVVSPDGRQVAYVVSAIDRESDQQTSAIFLSPLDGSAAPRVFTQGPHAQSPLWSPDGRSLAFLSNRGSLLKPGGGTQLFIAPLDGGEPRQLTQARGSATSPRWSPDGRSIVFVRSVGPKHGAGSSPIEKNVPRVARHLHYKFDGFGLYDARRRHLFVIDVETGTERQLTSGDWHDAQPTWSPDSKHIAFASNRRRDRWRQLFFDDVWLVSAKGGRARRLTGERGMVSAPSFSPDGREIAYVGHELGAAYPGKNARVFSVGVRGGRAPQCLTRELDLSVVQGPGIGDSFAWLPDGSGLVFLAPERGTIPIFTVDRASGAIKKRLDVDQQAQSLTLTPDGREVVFPSIWSSTLPEIMALRLSGRGRPRRISDANATLRREVALSPTERISYTSPDGLEIEAFVITPQGRARKPYPLELFIHGGPHGWHPGTHNMLHHQVMAAAGYAVLLPNPRGSTGYGEDFESACLSDWGGGDCADVLAGVDALVSRGVADPRQLYVGGYSYGGYMSSWIVTQDHRFRAAAIGAPITNLASGIGTDDIPAYNVEEMGGPPWECPDEYAARSPITHVANVRTPVLLYHWEGDLRCPIGQSEEFFAALQILRRRSEFVRYPGGAHGIRTPSQDADALQRIVAWYDKHKPR